MAPEIKYTKLFIDNEWVDAVSGKTFETFCPHDGSVIAYVSEGDEADIELAVQAARRTFQRNSEWRRLDASARRQLLDRFADLIDRDADYLAELESYNNGMVLSRARLRMKAVTERVRYVAGLADKYHGDTVPTDGNTFSLTLKQPIGVCGLILPFNFPIQMFINKVTPALAAGCPVVVKPAEQTPLTALYLAELLREAGVPRGVVNVVPGFGPGAGTALTHHPQVAKISFTGSVEVGKLIQQAAASNLKRVTLELGGKSPLIIMPDADLDAAVRVAASGIFASSGQVCVAASRLFVHDTIYDRFVEKAAEHATALKIGNPAYPDTDFGPQADVATFNKVLDYIEKGVKEGARLVTGGQRQGCIGYYVQPTVFADVSDEMTIAKEEIFGPVQSILKFSSLDEALERANATSYGLAAGIFTRDLQTALQFAKHVEAGTVWVNNYMVFCNQAPFGGFKESGVGRENGKDCLEPYLEIKTVIIDLPKTF